MSSEAITIEVELASSRAARQEKKHAVLTLVLDSDENKLIPNDIVANNSCPNIFGIVNGVGDGSTPDAT